MQSRKPRTGSGRTLVPVFRTTDLSLLLVIRSALEAAGIDCVIRGGGTLGSLPLGRFAVGVYRPVLEGAVLVRAEQADEARDYLRALEESAGRSGESS